MVNKTVIVATIAGALIIASAFGVSAFLQANATARNDLANMETGNEVIQANETGDGSICADYEEGETPPAHLNCDESVVEDEQPTAIDNMPTVIGRQPDITGPAIEECREPLNNAFEAVLQTDQFMEFSYISEHVQEVYCNDVHVIVPGILYPHEAYVLHKYPDRIYLNPSAYTLYEPERLAITLFHEARHLEQYEECKADKSLCMTSEEREADAVRFGNSMWEKLFPIEDQNPIIIVPPMSTTGTGVERVTHITLDYRPIN